MCQQNDRHCERSEAIHLSACAAMDCFRLRSPSFGGLPAQRSLRSKRRRVVAFAPRNDSGKTRDLILAACFSLESCQFVAPSLAEGAGKTGRRRHPQHRVQWVTRNAHGFDRYSRDIPAFPAQWFDGLYVLSPGNGLSCPRRRRDASRQLSARVAAPGPHDFAVRYSVFVGRAKIPTWRRSVHRSPHHVP